MISIARSPWSGGSVTAPASAVLRVLSRGKGGGRRIYALFDPDTREPMLASETQVLAGLILIGDEPVVLAGIHGPPPLLFLWPAYHPDRWDGVRTDPRSLQ